MEYTIIVKGKTPSDQSEIRSQQHSDIRSK